MELPKRSIFPHLLNLSENGFPKKERALATGIFNAGTNVEALLTPVVVPWIVKSYGWQAAFYLTGSLGLIWIIFWYVLYQSPEKHPRLTSAEMNYIKSDSQDVVENIPWIRLLGHPQT